MKTTFWQLLTNNVEDYDFKYGIVIPMIQRDYVQGRNNPKSTEIRKQFLDDIKNAIISNSLVNVKSLELDFIYGYIQNETFIPLDGQQRLTTLFLLHWYLALKADQLNVNKEFFNKFRYQVRPSTDDFFRNLIMFTHADFQLHKNTNTSLSDVISNKHWFLSKWNYDNTIVSSLKMIDHIHSNFNNPKITFDILTKKTNDPITFNFLDIKDLGLSDDLYIKMNARGVSLTGFENLKAELGKFIKDSKFNKKYKFKIEHSEGVSDFDTETYFLNKIDTTWTDYFWHLREKTTNVFDDKLLNLLAYISLTIKSSYNPVGFNSDLGNFRLGHFIPSFYQFHESDLLNEDSIILYIQTLDFLVSKFPVYEEYKKIDFHYFDLEEVLKESAFKTNFELDATNRIRIFALTNFLPHLKEKKLPIDESIKFERIIFNISSVPNFYNNYEDLSKSIIGINDFINNYNGDVYSQMLSSGLEGFDNLQTLEEKIKITLIKKSENWKNLIIEIEKDGYLKGHIAIVLYLSGIFAEYEISASLLWDGKSDKLNYDRLQKYYSKYQLYFDSKGLKKYDNQLFRTALLCFGSYLIHSMNWNFVQNEGRDVSWKRLFREINNGKFAKNIGYLKALLDESNIDLSDKINLQYIIKMYKPLVLDWRLDFIENPEVIRLMTYYAKFNENNDEIYLLNAQKFSSKAIDLDIYLIRKKLLKKNIKAEIVFDEKYWKSIIKGVGKKKSKVIHLNQGKNKFLLIQHGSADMHFSNRKKIIKYLVDNYF